MNIGELLKEAREANGYSLDDVQELTKIQKRYLVAIEAEDFHVLPGRFYARAFIKEYAQAVGLDANALLSGFDENRIETEEDTVQYTRLDKTNKPKLTKNTSILSFLPSIIVVLLVVAIIVIAWTLGSKSDADPDQPGGSSGNDEVIRNVDEEDEADQQDEAEEEDTEEEEETEEDLPEDNFEVVEQGTGNSPLSTLDFTYSGDKVEVVLEAEQDAYAEMLGNSENYYFASTLAGGTSSDTFDVSEEERIYLNIGNTNGLTVKINGVTLTYPVEGITHQKMWIQLKKHE